LTSRYFLDPYIIHLIGKDKKILDIGCGKGKWGFLIKTSYQQPKKIIGIDIWLQYLKYSKHHKVYDDVVLADARYLPIKDSSFDVVLGCEILEHLSSSVDGDKLLKEAERVCKEKVIISTPHELQEQGEVDSNPFQKHRIRWRPKDLKKRGYRVYGIGFSLLGHFSTPKLRIALSPLAYYCPIFGYLLIAEKYLNKDK